MTHDEIESLPVWESAALLSADLQTARHADPEVLSRFSQAAELLTFVDRYRNQPAWRFDAKALGALAELGTALNSLRASVRQLQEDPTNGPEHLSAFILAFESAVSAINVLPPPIVTSGHLKDITSITEQHRKAISQALSSTQDEVADILESVKALQAHESGLVEDIDRQESRITDQATRLDDALNRIGERFEVEVAERHKQYLLELETLKSDFAQLLQTVQSEASVQRKSEVELAETHLETLRIMRDDGKGLLDAVARKTISNQYAGYAWRQGLWATLWALAAIGLTVGGFVFLIMILKDVQSIELPEALLKGLASLAVLGGAAFAAAESSGHRNEAREAKRLQLDLNALEPAISRLDENRQENLRVAILTATFNRPRATSSSGRWSRKQGSSDNGDLLRAIQNLSQAIAPEK